MTFGNHQLLPQTLPKWRDPRGRHNAALRILVLAILFVLLGLFASQVYASYSEVTFGTQLQPDAPESTPVNRWKTHDGHDAPTGSPEPSVDHVVSDVSAKSESSRTLDTQSRPKGATVEPRIGHRLTKPWYWRFTDKFSRGRGALSEALPARQPQQESNGTPRPPYPSDAALPMEDIQYPSYTYGDRPYLGKVTVNVAKSDDTDNHYERAIRTHVTQNKMHNYPMYTLRYSLTTQEKQMWSKPAWLLSVMLRELAKPPEERLQWLFWVDADTVILNPKVPVETFLPPVEFDDIHLLLTNDFNGLNNGIFPIRVNLWSVDFLSAVMSFSYFRPDVKLQYDEQSAMEQLLKHPKFGQHTVLLPQRWFNAYPGELNETSQPYMIKRGDMLIHYAGFSNKKEMMSRWTQRIALHDPEWELDLRYTSYPNEVRDFWNEVRNQGKDKKAEVDKVQQEAHALIEDVKVYLQEYKEDLEPKRRNDIKQTTRALRKVLDDEVKREEVKAVRHAVDDLKEAAEPLINRARKANRILYEEAHGLLLRYEEERNDMPFAPGAAEESEALQSQLSHLRKLLIDSKANPRYLERLIVDVNSARDNLKQKIERLDIDKETFDDSKDDKHDAAGEDDLDDIDKDLDQEKKDENKDSGENEHDDDEKADEKKDEEKHEDAKTKAKKSAKARKLAQLLKDSPSLIGEEDMELWEEG